MQTNISNIKFVCTHKGWIGGSCKPSDKGMLTAFPHFLICQHNIIIVSNMLKFEELPEVNSERWLSLEDLEGEVWKQIPDYPMYYVSNYSRIKSFKNPKGPQIIKTRIVQYYYRIQLYGNDHISLHTSVHRCMAEAFIPNPYNLPQVNHKDENKLNNYIYINKDGSIDYDKSNLEWCTNSYNMNYGTRNERAGKGISEAMSIRIAQYSLDGKYMATFKSIVEASRILGLDIRRPKNGWKSQFSQSCGFMWRLYENGVDLTQDIPPYIQISGRAKIVEQYSLYGEYVTTYASLKYASDNTGISSYAINKCAKNDTESAGGYKWKFIDRDSVYNNLLFDKNGEGFRHDTVSNIDTRYYTKRIYKRKKIRISLWTE